jgi:hypothetical protein
LFVEISNPRKISKITRKTIPKISNALECNPTATVVGRNWLIKRENRCPTRIAIEATLKIVFRDPPQKFIAIFEVRAIAVANSENPIKICRESIRVKTNTKLGFDAINARIITLVTVLFDFIGIRVEERKNQLLED